LILALTILCISNNTCAGTRNCTKTEKQAANEQLFSIANAPDIQATLISTHLPNGLHTSNVTIDNEQVFYQSGYLVDHDTDLRTSLWVSYKLTKTDIDNTEGKDRVNCFRRDPRMSYSQTATPADYKEPIYDQGHMANDADLKDNLTEQINTYLMSNMSPQHCRFNRGIWLSLEHLTRKWANQYNTVYVTSGALFDRDKDAQRDADDQAIRMKSNSGKERVAIPSHYYKVIIRENNGGWTGVAFLMENTNDKHGSSWDDVKPDVIYSITNIGVIESLAGVTLHPNMDRVTFTQNLSDWDLSTNKANFEASCM